LNPYQSPTAGLERSGDSASKPRLSRASRNAIATTVVLLIAPLACVIGWTLPRTMGWAAAGNFDLVGLGTGLMIGIVGIALADFMAVGRLVVVAVYAFVFPILMTIVGMHFICYFFGDCV
jgi:hypothetical protein